MIHSRYFLIIFVLLLSIGSYAQGVDDRAKDKAENKANQRVDTRIDQGIDKGFDAIEGLFKKKKKKKSSEESEESTGSSSSGSKSEPAAEDKGTAPIPGADMFGSMFKPAEWEESYVFDFRSVAHVTTTDKKNKVEEGDMEWMLGPEAFGMIVKDPKEKNPDMKIVFDFDNHSFITLTEEDGEKTGMAIAMNQDQLNAAIEEGVDEGLVDNGNFKKTGRTKTILGYSCSEYTFSDEETEGVMWMTSELDVEMNKIYGMMTSGGSKKSNLPDNYPQGYVMEMENKDTKKNETHHYIITEVETDASIKVDLTPYNVMDPMSMMNQGKK